MPAPIVAAYDPFDQDPAPVELALEAGRLTGASVTAVAVYPSPLAARLVDPDMPGSPDHALIETRLRDLRQALGVVTRLVTDGSPPHALHGIARDDGAGLIVVGSTQRGRAGRVLPGSTAERLLHGAPCPVLLAPREHVPAPLATIAVGFVDSPEGHAALAAGHLVASRAGARLRVIAAVHPTGALDLATAPGTPPLHGIALEGHHRATIETALTRAVNALAPGVEIETELHVDDPADILLRVSEHVDLLVCGSRGYGPLRSVLLGGVSRRLVDAAHCPVLVPARGVPNPLEDLVRAVPSGAAATG